MGKYKFNGLTTEQVERSKEKHGRNELPQPSVETFWEKLIENFEDPLIKILCVALGITLFLAFLGYADWVEGLGIGVAVFLATFVSTYSEYKNESSFQDLQQRASKVDNKVFRNGEIVVIPVTEIVKGDYVLLESGDKIPADGPLIAGSMGVNQASLTGEPEPVKKSVGPENAADNSDKQPDDEFFVFRGTIVEEGDAVMIANTIGVDTFFGRLMKDIDESEDRKSPLEVKLQHLADGISTLGYIGAVFIFLSFLFKQFFMDQGYSLANTTAYITQWQLALHDTVTALILSIIIIVVAVPEGLPMMIAIVLSLNMKKLLDEQVLVRKLLGIETAGSLDILFTDKTGTITMGTLEPHVFLSGDCQSFSLHPQATIPPKLKSILYFCIKHASACHMSRDGTIVGGNSSDRAFFTILDKPFAGREDDVVIDKEIVFNSSLKFSGTSVIVNDKEAPKTLPKSFSILKGAPEKILPKCTHYFSVSGQLIKTKDLSALYEEVDVQSHSGIRVVAIAMSEEQLNVEERTLPEQMTLIGLIGLRDEIRKESKEAIQMAKNAGIQVVMITGDRKETAISIAREVGLLPETHLHDEDGSDRHLPRNSVFTSEQINKMTEEELIKILPNIKVIARALPTDKSRLVALCQKQDRVVGMTGDGVNDAAALSRADVGFAMGSGTEMAKEAADIVIMDDNFISITKAILYGRTIFRSIRKFITFQSTINVASTLIVFLGPFLGIDFPLTLIQLLWVNLVMDTLAALAFGGEPALSRYMHDKPIRRDEAIVSPEMYSSFLLGGTFIAGMSIAFLTLEAFKDFFVRDGAYYNEGFLTGFFGFFIFITTLNAFNVRTRKLNVFDNILKNPGFILVLIVIFCVQIIFTWIGGSVLRTVPLNYREWVVVISFSFIIFPFDLLRKVLIAPWLPKRLIDKTGLEHVETKSESPAKKQNNQPKKQISKERIANLNNNPNSSKSKEQKNKGNNKNQTSKDRKTNSNPSSKEQKKQNKPKNQ